MPTPPAAPTTPTVPATPAVTPVPVVAPVPASPSPQDALARVDVDLVLRVFETTSIRLNVEHYLPLITGELRKRGLIDARMVAMALGTIRAETADFSSVDEGISVFNSSHQDAAHAFDLYDNRLQDLGNKGHPDGRTYRGRGFVQLTGRANYSTYGVKIGVDLVNNPGRAIEPELAAQLLACYLAENAGTIRSALNAQDFKAARKAVNGGLHGFDEFLGVYQRCISLL
jgi:peptidoglycan L-alanyl-D-glutamate endopeptidase CwlK